MLTKILLRESLHGANRRLSLANRWRLRANDRRWMAVTGLQRRCPPPPPRATTKAERLEGGGSSPNEGPMAHDWGLGRGVHFLFCFSPIPKFTTIWAY